MRTNLLLVTLMLFPMTFLKSQSVQEIELQKEINVLKQKKDYQKDTAYLNRVNTMVFSLAENYPDSAFVILSKQLVLCRQAKHKFGEIKVLMLLGNVFDIKGDFGSALDYYNQSYDLANKYGENSVIPGILNNMGLEFMNQGNYADALKKFFDALKLAEEQKNSRLVMLTTNNIGNLYYLQGKFKEARANHQLNLEMSERNKDTVSLLFALVNLGEIDLELGETQQALIDLKRANQIASGIPDIKVIESSSRIMGQVYSKMDSIPQALQSFKTALDISREQDYAVSTCKSLIGLAEIMFKTGDRDLALQYAKEALTLSEKMGEIYLQRNVNELLSSIYASKGLGMEALEYYKKFKENSDSMSNVANERATATYQAEYNFSKIELEYKRKSLQQSWIIFSAIAALFTAVVIALIVNRNRQKLNLVNHSLQQKNIEIEFQKNKVEDTLEKLKKAQTQLVYAEKMASLGELTAGIAHEIQNPLNFINNFSEVSKELLEEMGTELDEGHPADAKEIAKMVMDNMEKIYHHGQRADGIVKSMLFHSRTNRGDRESTDLTKLCEEYVKLSFNGMKSKDPSFDVKLEVSYDQSIGRVNIYSQDLGRVILNLLNNAFAAVQEKKSTLNQAPYHGLVKLQTVKGDKGFSVFVEDNGIGMPESIKTKIFQPFFTTKPTGTGTGLGLSISYDIVTKVHAGTLTVESEEGLFTKFTMYIPFETIVEVT